MKVNVLIAFVVFSFNFTPVLLATSIFPEEQQVSETWAAMKFAESAAGIKSASGLSASFSREVPFSFKLDGVLSNTFLNDWRVTRDFKDVDHQKTTHTVQYTDPKTGLVLRCESIVWQDFPTVEWIVYLKNTGMTDSPLISDLLVLDSTFASDPTVAATWKPSPTRQWFEHERYEFLLHHWRGCVAENNDYEPLMDFLDPRKKLEFSPPGGLSTEAWPYYNLELPGEGVIVTVGWPGKWAAGFERDEKNGIRITAGQKQTRFILHPGEEVRTPLVVLQFYQDDWIRGQNIWRGWMIQHSLHRPGGQMPGPQYALGEDCGDDYTSITEKSQMAAIEKICSIEGLKPDIWWIDAGWYDCNGHWPTFGSWIPDPKRFPNGLRPISDFAQSKGMKMVTWFVPEVAHAGTWLDKNRPQWFEKGNIKFGDPAARDGITEYISDILQKEGIAIYRQDFGGGWFPDEANRLGINENKYVSGMLAFWDGLLERNPGLMIDMCSGGGRRNDLEAMRRAVPLWYSDNVADLNGILGKTYGIAFWLPLFGTCFAPHVPNSPYDEFRGRLTPCLVGAFNPNKEYNFDAWRKLMAQWRKIAPCYLGDYYPLTPYSRENETWLVWQYDRPDLGEGFVQAAVRSKSPFMAGSFQLRGLDSEAMYEVTNFDEPEKTATLSGKELLEQGLILETKTKPAGLMYSYKRR